MRDLSGFMEALAAGDQRRAADVLRKCVEAVGAQAAMHELVKPVLDQISRSFEDAAAPLTFAHGYVAAKLVEEVVLPSMDGPNGSSPALDQRRRAVIANAEDDYHALGRKLVVACLRSTGWEIHDLGNDVVPLDLIDAVERVQAPVVGVSAMTATTARNIEHVRAEIDRRGLSRDVKLAVGGAVFNVRPELVAEVGADGTCPNAFGAPGLLERLGGFATGRGGEGDD